MPYMGLERKCRRAIAVKRRPIGRRPPVMHSAREGDEITYLIVLELFTKIITALLSQKLILDWAWQRGVTRV